MRKFFFWFGIAAAIIAVILIAAFAYIAIHGSALDKSSKEAAEHELDAITGHWDQSALLKDSSPELLNIIGNGDQLSRLFTLLTTLGPLTQSNGCNGNATILITAQQGKRITANYVCLGDYANGKAKVTLQLIKINDDWRVNGFHVDSPKFLPPAAQSKA